MASAHHLSNRSDPRPSRTAALMPLGALACGLGLQGMAWAADAAASASEPATLPRITVTAPDVPVQGRGPAQEVRRRRPGSAPTATALGQQPLSLH